MYASAGINTYDLKIMRHEHSRVILEALLCCVLPTWTWVRCSLLWKFSFLLRRIKTGSCADSKMMQVVNAFWPWPSRISEIKQAGLITSQDVSRLTQEEP